MTILGTRAGKVGNSTLSSELGCHYQATLKKLVVNPGEDGGQELVATFALVPNSAVDELVRFVGQAVMLRVQPRQLPLSLDNP